MRRWATDWFSPHAGQWASRRRAYSGAPGGTSGPIVMIVLFLLVLFLLFAPIWQRTALSWTEPAGNVKLATMWTKALADLDLHPSQARLSSFHGSWNGDGSLQSLQFTVDTSRTQQIVVFVQRRIGSGEVDVLAGKYESIDLYTPFQGTDSAALPGADQVFRSLDAAGIMTLAAATGAVLQENEVLELDLAGTSLVGPEAPEGPVFTVAGGKVVPLSTAAASPSPSFGFSLARVETVGRKAAYYSGWFFVR